MQEYYNVMNYIDQIFFCFFVKTFNIGINYFYIPLYTFLSFKLVDIVFFVLVIMLLK